MMTNGDGATVDSEVKCEPEGNDRTTVTVMAMNASGLPVARVTIHEREVQLKIDTGAACSIAGVQ